MYAIEGGELRLHPRLSEVTLRACAEQIAGESLDLPSILLNSVMVPVGRRNKLHHGGHIEVAFAHTSFQEFFLARHILAALLEKNIDPTILHSVIPKPVTRFLQQLISTLPPDQQALARSSLDPRGDMHGI
jgi:hypothetical protein